VRWRATLVAAGIAALLLTAGVSGKPLPARLPGPGTITYGIGGLVTGLAADGPVVAFYERVGNCSVIHFWNPGDRFASKGKDRCGPVSIGNVGHTDGDLLALGGTRALWVDHDNSGHVYCASRTATARAPTPVNAGLCSGKADDDVASIAGGSGLLVLDHLHFTFCSSCAGAVTVPLSGATASDITLVSVDANGKGTTIASGRDALLVTAVDAGRLLLVRPDGRLAILSASGTVLDTIPLPAATATVIGAALQGDDIILVTSGEFQTGANKGDAALVLWNISARDGTVKKKITIDAQSRFGGVQSGLLAYTLGPWVTIVRLRDGRSVTIEPGSWEGNDVFAALTSVGLFYSYVQPTRHSSTFGRVAFVPLTDVEHAVP
jgi:hypothetical protein